ncbi:MAG: hypothetical protein ATN35_13425 [Epulopiscium sp. Nele67-Bin004]|nr:MAG: hypothetical protein ATN35_13425 [Epulopiscium sp. Nele67-Bin004]
MNETAKQLRQLYIKYGDEIFMNSMRLKGLLLDLMHKATDINIILRATECDVATMAIDRVATHLDSKQINIIIGELTNKFIWDKSKAKQAVDYFIYAKFGAIEKVEHIEVFKPIPKPQLIKTQSPDNHFEFNEAYGTIKKYISDDPICIIPKMINGVLVKAIGDRTFSRCDHLRSVEIPTTVKTIGQSAFSVCINLDTVKIPNSVTNIGNSAFYGCSSLQAIDLPANITSIGSDTFYGCVNLKTITIPNTVVSIGSGAFYMCSSLMELKLPHGITSIEYHTFNGCKSLKRMEIPNTIKSIGQSAFSNCTDLQTINIPSSVITISNKAFVGCPNLEQIKIPKSVINIAQNVFDETIQVI